MLRLAVIGVGGRAAGVISTMREIEPEVQVVAVADPDNPGAQHRLRRIAVPIEPVTFYDSADSMLGYADQYDGVLIGTRCREHTLMACKVAPTQLPLYLEKPVAITRRQLDTLAGTFRGREQNVLVSFPLRTTPLYAAALEIVRSNRLGTINQIQANNNVPYGGVYYGQWYRNYDEVGGLWLQKATHDFNYLAHMIDARPLTIAATATQKIYGGTMPHELRCTACDQTDTCIESHKNQRLRGDAGGMENWQKDLDHWCPFSREIKNQDAGSALLLFEGGAHVCYAQNFVSRRQAGKRGAVVTGHLATLEFDWYTEIIRVFDHHKDRVDEIRVKASTGHAGGDHGLAKNFVAMMRHEAKSAVDLRDGILSVSMCLAARESAYHRRFEPVLLPGSRAEEQPAITTATEVPVP